MANENRVIFPDKAPSFETVRGYAWLAILKLAVLIAGAIWIVFWGLIARLHYHSSDFLSMAVLSVLFILPAIIGIGYYFLSAIPMDLGH